MRVIDLFAGCGGLSLGFSNAGYEVVAAFDNWDAAIKIYQANFQHPIYKLDLDGLLDIQQIAKFAPDMIIGGPPCQDFSSAGKRDESLGRADLTIQFAQIISRIKPKWFLMENVERIKKSSVLKTSKKIFQDTGYTLTETTLNAALCGVPQSRKRYFLIGELNGKSKQLLKYLKKDLAQKPMTIHDYLGDSLGIDYYYRHPRSYARRAIFSIHEASPTIRGVNRPVPSTYKKHPNDAGEVNDSLRPLTTIERSYIQTFPKNFRFEGTKTDLEQMIGNAVPVKQAEFVAKAILNYIHSKSVDSEEVENQTQLQLL